MSNEQTILQRPRTQQFRAVADIVFVVDASFSMGPVIAGVKENIEGFVKALSVDPRVGEVDVRLGVVAHQVPRGQIIYSLVPFTNQIQVFQAGLSKIVSKGDEHTLPALDFALDMDWRPDARRIVIAFTDEPATQSFEGESHIDQLPALLRKVYELGVILVFFGPRTKEYQSLQQIPKSIVQFIRRKQDLHRGDFSEIMRTLGGTLSTMIGPGGAATRSVAPPTQDLFGVRSRVRLVSLT